MPTVSIYPDPKTLDYGTITKRLDQVCHPYLNEWDNRYFVTIKLIQLLDDLEIAKTPLSTLHKSTMYQVPLQYRIFVKEVADILREFGYFCSYDGRFFRGLV